MVPGSGPNRVREVRNEHQVESNYHRISGCVSQCGVRRTVGGVRLWDDGEVCPSRAYGGTKSDGLQRFRPKPSVDIERVDGACRAADTADIDGRGPRLAGEGCFEFGGTGHFRADMQRVWPAS